MRIGIIGCGKMGSYLASNLKALNAEIVYAQRQDIEKFTEDFRHNHPDTLLYDDPTIILDDSSVDAVVVASPTPHHYEQVKAALESGKHVLVEKPMCETTEQAKELVQLAESKGLTLMIDHTLLFTPQMRWLNEQIQAENLKPANITHITATRNAPATEKTANWPIMPDMGVHALYVIDALMQNDKVTVNASSDDVCADGKITLKFGNGSSADIHLERKTQTEPQRNTSIEVRNGSLLQTIEWDEIGQPHFSIKEKSHTRHPFLEPDNNPLRGVAQHFMECARKGKVSPICGGLQGLRSMQLLEAIEASCKEPGRAQRIFLDPLPGKDMAVGC